MLKNALTVALRSLHQRGDSPISIPGLALLAMDRPALCTATVDLAQSLRYE